MFGFIQVTVEVEVEVEALLMVTRLLRFSKTSEFLSSKAN